MLYMYPSFFLLLSSREGGEKNFLDIYTLTGGAMTAVAGDGGGGGSCRQQLLLPPAFCVIDRDLLQCCRRETIIIASRSWLLAGRVSCCLLPYQAVFFLLLLLLCVGPSRYEWSSSQHVPVHHPAEEWLVVTPDPIRLQRHLSRYCSFHQRRHSAWNQIFRSMESFLKKKKRKASSVMRN